MNYADTSAQDAAKAGLVVSTTQDSPDEVANDRRLARQFSATTGKPTPPTPLVKQFRPLFKQHLDQSWASTSLRSAPLLSQFMLDPEVAAMAKDDIDSMSWWERTYTKPMETVKGVVPGAIKATGSALSGAGALTTPDMDSMRPLATEISEAFGLPQEQIDELRRRIAEQGAVNPQIAQSVLSQILSGDMPAEEALAQLQPAITPIISPALKSAGKATTEFGDELLPAIPGMEDSMWREVGEGLGSIFPVIGAALLGGPLGAGAVGGSMGAGEAAERARQAGEDEDMQAVAAFYGFFPGLTDMIPVERLVNNPVTRKGFASLIRQVGIQAGIEGGQEAIQELLQNGIEQMLYNQDQTLTEDIMRSFTTGGIVGAITEAGRAALMAAMPGRAQRFADAERRAADEAAQTQELLSGMVDNALGSKFRERAPDLHQAYVDRVLKGKPVENLYMDPEKLIGYFQNQEDAEAFLADMGSSAEDLQTALDTGGQVKIKTSDFISKAVGTDAQQFVVDNATFGPDQYSVAETTERQGSFQELMREALERAEEASIRAIEFDQIEQTVTQSIRDSLIGSGQYGQEAADSMATMWGSFYATMAANTGRTLSEQLALPQIRGAQPTGVNAQGMTSLEQDNPAFKEWFGQSKVVDDQGNPITVYHASTYGDIEAFNKAEQRFGKAGYGFYFSDPNGANLFAEFGEKFQMQRNYKGDEKKVNITPAYLKMENPLVVDHVDDLKPYLDVGQVFGAARGIGKNLTPEAKTKLQQMGYDGIITRETTAKKVGKGGLKILDRNDPNAVSFPVYVVLEPTQIKSVNNRGTFDPQDPRILYQTATVRRGEETLEKYGLDPKKKYTTREVAAALEARQRKKYGTIEPDDRSAEASKRIAKWMLEEVLFEVEYAQRNPEKSAVGWYSVKFQRALDRLAGAFPEFVDDGDLSASELPGVKILGNKQNARDFFTALMAITSDGAKVADNFRFASAAYETFRQTGKINSDITFGGERNKSMRVNLENIQKTLDTYGAEGMAQFLLKKDTVSNLKKMAKASGEEFNVAYKASMMMPYSAIVFGPKLGAFYANLMGDTGYLTMDRWWSRTFNRYRGTLLQKPTDVGLQRMKELLVADKKLNIEPTQMTDDEAIAGTVDYVRSYKAKGYKGGTEIEKAANTIYKAAFEGLEDQPFNASDREFMINTTLEAQKMLKRKGVDLTVADVQAVLWYYEKRLYGELGARQTQDISYEEIANDIISGRDPAAGSADDVSGETGDALSLDISSNQSDPGVGVATDLQDEAFRPDVGGGAGGYQSGGLAPLPGAPTVQGASGPDIRLVRVAEEYARSIGLDLKRQAEFVEVDPERAARIAQAYEEMKHDPSDPAVAEAYQNLIAQTVAQYRALEAAGYKLWFLDPENDPYAGNPWNAMRDLRANQSMGVFPTEAGFGSGATDIDISDNPLMADTGIEWGYGSPDGPKKRVLANDLFRAVHDAFGHGLEGAGFRARGEENAWQAHIRLFTGSAQGAITSETRGQNSWLNYGPYGEKNRTASVEETVFADQKTGLMPEWTWTEGRAADEEPMKTLEQVSPQQAISIDMNVEMPSDPIFAEAVSNTNGAKISEDGLLLDLVRFQKPEQEGSTSVRTGVFYLPVGSPNARHYKSGGQPGQWYGGSVKVQGETLIKRPLFVKGATGGKAPEAAFDAINGKGAAKKLNDAARAAAVNPALRRDPGLFAQSISNFLNEYGADGSMASEIIENSKLGNQLTYALQENVVAHAVREAGYDAVVGYSKGKSGAFISEVFDVREIDYPTPGQTAELHPSFKMKARLAQQAKGSIMYPASGVGSGDIIINLFQSADFSTFLHESGHFFLLALQHYAQQGDQFSQSMMADVNAWVREHAADVAKHANRNVAGANVTAADVVSAIDNGSQSMDPALADAVDVGIQELWARTFEVYLYEGKAPSVKLRTVFGRFADWLRKIYTSITGLGAKPDDRIREVFDRMLATDEQIQEARDLAGRTEAIFTSAEQMGMTQEQYQAFQTLYLQAGDEQRAKLYAKTMEPIALKKRKEYRIKWNETEAAVEAEMRADPIQRAVKILRYGRDFDDSEVNLKLDRAAIEADFGKDFIASLPGATKDGHGHKNAVFAHEGGVHPDLAADMLGLPSGRDLLLGLTTARPFDEAVASEVKRRMDELYPDPLMSAEIEQEAQAAVHGDKAGKVIATELKALSDIAGEDLDITADDARNAAIAALERMTVRDATSSKRFLAAERRAGTNAERLARQVTRTQMWMDAARRRVGLIARTAVREQDPALAGAVPAAVEKANQSTSFYNKNVGLLLKAKRDQLMNFMLFSESTKLDQEIEKIADKLWKLSKTDKKLSKGMDADYVKAARALAGKFDLARPDSDFDFTMWIEQLRADDPIRLSALTQVIDTFGQQPKPYTDLTVAELRTVLDALAALLEQGKRMKSIEVEGKQIDREKAIGDLVDTINTHGPKANDALKRSLTDAEKRKNWFLSIRAALTRVESWARYMDDGKQGPFTNYIVRPIMDAVGIYKIERSKRLKQLMAILDERTSTLTGAAIPAPELGDGVVFDNKGQLLHAILHTGNESNMEKLLVGRGWSTGFVNRKQKITKGGKPSVSRKTGLPILDRGELDTARWDAFLDRMITEGMVTKEDFDTAQRIWDLMEELKRPAQTTHKKVFGFYFKEVQAKPIKTPFGTYKGGYVPAIADKDASNDGLIRADQQAMEQQQTTAMFPTAGSGFTKSRVQYNTALALDLTLIPAHMDKVLRFTHLEPAIRQTAGLVTNRELRASLDKVNRDIIPSAVMPWLQATGQQAVEAPHTVEAMRSLMKPLREIRKRVGLSTMFANVINTVQNVTGFSSAMVLVGPGNVRRSFLRFSSGGRKQMREFAINSSPFMRSRVTDMERELQTRIQDLVVKREGLEPVREWANRHGYFLQTALQNPIDVITWNAAYDQALAKGMTHSEASFEADSVIRRTMGDFSPENMSTIERQDAVMRILTMFASYFNTQANLIVGESATAIRTMGLFGGSRRVAMIYALGIAIPAIVGKMISEGMRGELGDEDDDGYLDDIMGLLGFSQVAYVTAMVPVLGQFGNVALSRWTSDPFDDNLTNPVVSGVTRAAKTPGTIWNAVAGDGKASKAVADSIYSLGLILGIPTGQLAKTLGYAAKVAEGSANPQGVVDVAQGVVTGSDGTK